MVRKAVSFGLVGAINAAVDAAIFFLALKWLTGSLIAANVIAWAVAVSGSYVMNSFTTFAAESGRQLRLHDYLRFVGSGVLGVVANTIVLVVASWYLPVWFAKLLAIGTSFVVNFSMSHFLIFPAARASRPNGHTS